MCVCVLLIRSIMLAIYYFLVYYILYLHFHLAMAPAEAMIRLTSKSSDPNLNTKNLPLAINTKVCILHIINILLVYTIRYKT